MELNNMLRRTADISLNKCLGETWGLGNATRVVNDMVHKVLFGQEPPESLINPFGAQLDLKYINCMLQTLCVGYDINDQSKTALYTSNYEVLSSLDSAGYLEGYDEVKAYDVLVSKIDKKRAKEGYYGVRLDFNGIRGNTPKYTVKIQHKLVPANQFMIVPLSCYYAFFDVFNEYASKMVLEVTTSWEGRESKRIVTTSPYILGSVYKNQAVVDRKTKYGIVGVSPSTFHIMGYNLQASPDNIQSTGFSIRAFKDINAYNAGVDTIKEELPDNFIRYYFGKKVVEHIKLNDVGFKSLGKKLGIPEGETAKETYKNWYGSYSSMPTQQLMGIMQSNPSIFGNAESEIRAEMEKRNAIATSGKDENFDGKTTEEVMTDIKSMLSKGSVKLTFQKKDGTFKSVLATNNALVLEKVYGENYVAEFESPKVRMGYARTLLQNGMDIGKVDARCGFKEILGMEGLETSNEEFINYIDQWVAQQKKSADRKGNWVNYRSLTATNSQDYWGCVDADKVVECTYYAQ